MCKINPKVDFAFKKLFGSEENKDLLISLINSIVDYKDKIVDATIKNPYNLADYKADKMSILDIKAVSEKGIWYNVEMQVGEDFNFDKRAIYYWAEIVTDQLSEGHFYKKLEKTISINILDFNMTDTKTFHNKYQILNTKTKENDGLHDVFEMHYIELQKFQKDYKDIVNALDRWVTFLNKANSLDKNNLPKELILDEKIVKAITEVDKMFDEDEREVYRTRRKIKMDFDSRLDTALTKGLMKGMEQGIEKGIEKGKLEIIKTLLDILDDDIISNKTGISIEKIKHLRNNK